MCKQGLNLEGVFFFLMHVACRGRIGHQKFLARVDGRPKHQIFLDLCTLQGGSRKKSSSST